MPFLAVLLIFVSGMVVLKSYSRGFLSPHFLVCALLFWGTCVRALVVVSFLAGQSDYSLALLYFDSSALLETLVFFLIYAGSFEFFAFLFRKSVSEKLSAPTYKHWAAAGEMTSTGYRLLMLAAAIAWLSYFWLVTSRFGSIEAAAIAFAERVSGNVQGLAYSALLVDFFLVVTLYLYLSYRAGWFRRAIVVRCFLALAFGTLIFLSGRGSLLQFLLSVLIVRSVFTQRRTGLKLHVLVFPLVVLMVAVGGLSIRNSAQQGIPLRDALQQTSQNALSTVTSPFAIYDQYLLAKEYVALNGHDHGLLYAEVLTRPVPRSFWPEKPLPLSIRVREQFWGDRLGGTPPGLPGEAFIAFGYVGFLLVPPLLGLLVWWLEAMFRMSAKENRLVLLPALLVPIVSFSLVRSGVDVAFARLVIYLFVLGCICRVSRTRLRWTAS